MKKYPHGLTLNAVCAAIDDYQRHEDSVPEEGILAAFNTLLGHSDIADALRSMERTADTNMAAAQAMRDDMYHWKQRAESAEAKVAEYEKQEPYGFVHNMFDPPGCGVASSIFKEENRHYGRPVFTRPASTINIADLVPSESSLADKHIEWLSTLQRAMFSDDDWEELTLFTWLAFRDSARVQRAAILRNIEEAK